MNVDEMPWIKMWFCEYCSGCLNLDKKNRRESALVKCGCADPAVSTDNKCMQVIVLLFFARSMFFFYFHGGRKLIMPIHYFRDIGDHVKNIALPSSVMTVSIVVLHSYVNALVYVLLKGNSRSCSVV